MQALPPWETGLLEALQHMIIQRIEGFYGISKLSKRFYWFLLPDAGKDGFHLYSVFVDSQCVVVNSWTFFHFLRWSP